ncbi:MAG TPA: AAA family ATPase [Capillimicrobium sp.]|nr:AAA family ATPase [Capillimicrobium sp.]
MHPRGRCTKIRRVQHSTTLVGRDPELAALRERIEATGAGRGFAVVVEGEPGIGKTALLDAVAAAAPPGHRVLRASAAEPERSLPFSALAALVEPLVEARAALPAAQAHALTAALEVGPAGAPDRFAVVAALVGLLRAGASGGPLVAIVDDLHWIDDASREAIVFAARRAGDLGVGFVLAARPAAAPPGVERLTLDPLPDGSARALLRRADATLPASVAGDVVAAAGGNPLALLTLPALMTEEQRAGRAPIDLALEPGGRLDAAFTRQLLALPGASRQALAVAAAMERGPAAWLLAALEELGLEEDALADAEALGALRLDAGELTFRHAVLRAAAYQAADAEERRAAHRALAATTDDARRRAWHLAAAVQHGGEAVAAALEAAARAARAVGGHAEAAAAFARAGALSPDAAAGARREVEAARDLAVVGRAHQALALLEGAEERVGPDERAGVARLLGSLRLRGGDPAGAHATLGAEAARRMAADDPGTATELLLEAVVALTMTGDDAERAATLARLDRAARRAGGDIRVAAAATVAQDLVARGREAEGRLRLEALSPELEHLDPVAYTEPIALTAQAWLWIGDHARAQQLIDPVLARVEEAGAIGRLPYPLSVRAQLELRRGRWSAALRQADEAARLAVDLGQSTMASFILTVLARAEAGRGDVDAARRHVAEAADHAERGGARGHLLYADAALGFVELAAGRPGEAIAPLERAAAAADAAGYRHPGLTMSAGDLVEALLAKGLRDDADARTAGLVTRAATTGSAWGQAVAARCQLLLDDDAAIDEHAARARRCHEALDMPFERARTELAIGDRLRRARRRADARAPLQRAVAMFGQLGALPWQRRALELLEAAGEPARQSSLAGLTDEERRVAVLVSRGLSNLEIAEALFVSRKTIERRLTVIFSKLGVRTRTALARLVTEAQAARD